MFVDYNERNIIIEDDSIKDGIRRQTLDMLQEKGGTISCFDNKLLNQMATVMQYCMQYSIMYFQENIMLSEG